MIHDSKGSLSNFKNGDRRIVPAADDEIMEMWKNFSRSAILVLEVDTSVRSLIVIWDGSLVVAANNNGTCYVWRLQRGTQTMTNFEPLHKLQAHDGYILKCLLSPGQIARVAIIFRVDVGLLPPLDAPHHLRKHEWVHIGKVNFVYFYFHCVTQKERGLNNTGTQVDVGLMKNVVVDQNLEPGIRVTVEMGTDHCLETYSLRKVVPSSTPRKEGSYWGYKVRYAPNINFVFKYCPFELGPSEHGVVLSSSEMTIPTFRHLLISFGDLAGLEECIEEYVNLKGKDSREIFDKYLNIFPHQGSRTIRTKVPV
ncbi:hypothetical protein C5167_021296 [Papaver somniferum]|uniref:Uncharacterized protein n=1 Tax=Papaver somniferum TaxID=3469 RepID=A0A4Y7IVI6_PAPSO|nr:hypothetical protein C5167_021296 [Papaver somniferum]